MFRFKCTACDEIHEGMPSFGTPAPRSYYDVPEQEREARCDLGSDDCVIDGQYFFVRACLDIPVQGASEAFSWGVWVSLSEASYTQWVESYEQQQRAHIGPFFGWLNTWLPVYPDTAGIKTLVHLQDHGMRPCVVLEPSDHPLALEQQQGISVERVAEIYALLMHDSAADAG